MAKKPEQPKAGDVINFVIDDEKTITSIRKDTVLVVMAFDGAYKTAQYAIKKGDDPENIIDQKVLHKLWKNAKDADKRDFSAVQERPLRIDFYAAIIEAARSVALNGGDLAMARAAALAVIGENEEKLAEYQKWLVMLGLSNPDGEAEERDQLLWTLLYAAAGMQAGEQA